MCFRLPVTVSHHSYLSMWLKNVIKRNTVAKAPEHRWNQLRHFGNYYCKRWNILILKGAVKISFETY